jgi:nucleoside-diphosphate-sugar epimerase
MKKILIIGGDGYIGSRLYLDMCNEYEIVSLDLCWFSEPRKGTIEEDFRNLDRNFYKSFDCIILLAGHSSVNMCEGKIENAFKNNVENFLDLISKLGPKQKFIYASSSSVYGNSGSLKVDEKYTDFIPHNHYDITKHVIDLYSPKFDVEYYGLRFGTVNGYSPRTRSDVMINSMIYNAKINGEIKLYVKDIMRPILGISDLSLAIQKIIKSEKDQRGVYNLASFNKTAEEIAIGISKYTGYVIKDLDDPSLPITNSKLQTKSYNFSIDCSKFENNFNFRFKDTIETISEEIIQRFDTITFTNRSSIKEYE